MADFGCASTTHCTSTRSGTVEYAAPEVCVHILLCHGLYSMPGFVVCGGAWEVHWKKRRLAPTVNKEKAREVMSSHCRASPGGGLGVCLASELVHLSPSPPPPVPPYLPTHLPRTSGAAGQLTLLIRGRGRQGGGGAASQEEGGGGEAVPEKH